MTLLLPFPFLLPSFFFSPSLSLPFVSRYGQTGSGKTYTMMGYDSEKGLIPRICETLFYFIDTYGSGEMQSKGVLGGGGGQLQVDATYLEIYQEKIIDLLNASSGQSGPLKPKERLKVGRTKLMLKFIAAKDQSPPRFPHSHTPHHS